MAVLIEAISVVVRVDRILGKFRGGIEAFKRILPNENFCADGELARVGFMAPNDVKAFVTELEAGGLQHLDDKRQAIDISVIDQRDGPMAECSWAEFGTVSVGSESSQHVAVCRLTGGKNNQVVMPPHWKYEGSLSQSFRFVRTEDIQKEMRFLRHERDLDVYLDLATGKEMYVGRTTRT